MAEYRTQLKQYKAGSVYRHLCSCGYELPISTDEVFVMQGMSGDGGNMRVTMTRREDSEKFFMQYRVAKYDIRPQRRPRSRRIGAR